MKRSSSTIPQTHILFVPNIKGLAQTVLTWEGKVFAAADADAADADAAETDWKHKVTPERGDLIMDLHELNYGDPYIELWSPVNRILVLHKYILDSHQSIMDFQISIM